jgi:hypothetical protein
MVPLPFTALAAVAIGDLLISPSISHFMPPQRNLKHTISLFPV